MRRAAVWLAVLGLAAATCSPALAESGAPEVPLPAVPDLAATAATMLQETLPEVPLPQADLPELEPVVAVASPTALPAVPAQTTAAKPVTAGAGAAPPPAPASPQAVAAEPAQPTPDVPPAAVAQTAPANVNVSVRVDSPGDNGDVEQTNAAAATTTAQYQPDAPGYQQPIPEAGAAAADPAADIPAATDASGSEWNWSWNCIDAAPQIAPTPNGPVQNWTWNWKWDCAAPEKADGNEARQSGGQYQPLVSQYRPININISIRINSPGNDGRVTQTNVAAATTTFVFPTVRVEVPSPSSPAEVMPGPALVVSAAAPEPVPAEPSAQLVELLFDEAAAIDPCCLVFGTTRGDDLGAAPPAPDGTTPAPDAAPRDISAPARFRAAVEVTLRLTRASEEASRKARTAAKRQRAARPAPPHRSHGPSREPAAVLNSGFAPQNAADGRPAQLVLIVLWLTFLFAFADATRSVAAEVRATGEDLDPPPDRPG